MADSDPMGGGDTVALTLTDRQRRYLRRAIADCKAGREDDLRTHPDHPNAGRWRTDAAAYGRIGTLLKLAGPLEASPLDLLVGIAWHWQGGEPESGCLLRG